METEEHSSSSASRREIPNRRLSWLRSSFGLRRPGVSINNYTKSYSDNSSTLIVNQQWKLLRKYLSTAQGSTELTQLLTETLPRRRSNNYAAGRATLLHTCCQLHPPLDIVTRMVQLCPLAAHQRDASGRYPLHVAAAFGASPQVVHFLILQNQSAAACQDLEGKTPLHLSCEYGCFEGACDPGDDTNDNVTLVKGPILKQLRDLFSASAMAINQEDNDGCTPLELSITLNANLNVIHFLQKLSIYMTQIDIQSANGQVFFDSDHASYANHLFRTIQTKLITDSSDKTSTTDMMSEDRYSYFSFTGSMRKLSRALSWSKYRDSQTEQSVYVRSAPNRRVMSHCGRIPLFSSHNKTMKYASH